MCVIFTVNNKLFGVLQVKNNQGNQTESVKQALICHITDMRLNPGDKLPSQNVLREHLKVGAFTIQRAINALRSDGILETKPYKGVFVRNVDINGYVGREIGLVSMWRTFSPSVASLMQCLQLQLHKQACQCKLFLRNSEQMTEVDTLSIFDGLRRCIESKRIQGLITTVSFDQATWDFFQEQGLPIISLGTASRNGGYKVQAGSIIPQAFSLAHERGYEHPALLHSGYPFTREIRSAFSSLCNLPVKTYCRFLFPEMIVHDIPRERAQIIHRILDEFLAMPQSRRPDVLIIPDDFITVTVNQYLMKKRLAGGLWTPHLIYWTNKQIPIFQTGDIAGDYFEYDIMKTAEKAVSLMLDVIRGKIKSEVIITNEPELHRMEDVK